MAIQYYINDLPNTFQAGTSIAIDTETMGLKHSRDRLCVVQISTGDGNAHVVHFPEKKYDCPNLKKVLNDKNILKIFHFARFDIAVLNKYLNVECAPVYCTKIASKLVRTYTDRHGLKNLVSELLGVEMNKQQQSSYWGTEKLTKEQLEYASSDVLYLHKLKDILEHRLERENRKDIAQKCFDFLPHRATLDLIGWEENDIFSHR